MKEQPYGIFTEMIVSNYVEQCTIQSIQEWAKASKDRVPGKVVADLEQTLKKVYVKLGSWDKSYVLKKNAGQHLRDSKHFNKSYERTLQNLNSKPRQTFSINIGEASCSAYGKYRPENMQNLLEDAIKQAGWKLSPSRGKAMKDFFEGRYWYKLTDDHIETMEAMVTFITYYGQPTGYTNATMIFKYLDDNEKNRKSLNLPPKKK